MFNEKSKNGTIRSEEKIQDKGHTKRCIAAFVMMEALYGEFTFAHITLYMSCYAVAAKYGSLTWSYSLCEGSPRLISAVQWCIY